MAENYIYRKIDPEKWKRVKSKAALEGRTVRQVLDAFIDAWLADPSQDIGTKDLPASQDIRTKVSDVISS